MRPISRETILTVFRSIAILIIFAVISIFAGNAYAGAGWIGPTSAPPLNNVLAPLNQGTQFGINASGGRNGDIVGTYNNLKVDPTPCANGQILMWDTSGGSGHMVCGTPLIDSYWKLNGSYLFASSTNFSVGIGTNVPNKSLHIASSTGNAEIDIQSVGTPGDGNNSHWGLYADANNNSLNIWGSSNWLTILRNGNIGINTSIPSEKLSVNGKIFFTPQSGSAGYILSAEKIGNPIIDDRLILKSTTNRNRLWLDTTGVGSGAAISFASNGTEYMAVGDATADYSGAIYGLSLYQNDDFIIRTGNQVTTEKFRLTTGGNVGIGSDNPGAKLEVSGQSMFGSTTEALGVGKNLIYGNVGPTAVSGNLMLLQKNGSNRFTVDLNGNASSSASIGAPQVCIGTDCRGVWPTGGSGGGTDSFWATSTGSQTNIYNKAAGNVGIGMAASDVIDAPLEIKTFAASGSEVKIWDGSWADNEANGFGIFGAPQNQELGGVFFRYRINSDPTGPSGLQLRSGGVDALTILNTNSNVGIGTVLPNTKLEVVGKTSSTQFCLAHNDCITSWPSGGSGSVNGGINYVAKFTNATAVGNSQIFDDGTNVGIGTATPGYPLQVKSAAVTAVASVDDWSAGGLWTGYRMSRSNTEKWFVGIANNSDNLLFRRTGNANDMVINTLGNVGIGTPSPQGKFEVMGTGANPSLSAANGIFYIDGNVTQGLDFGEYTASPWAFWMQTRRNNQDGSSWPLAINPLGGYVGIGTNAPSATLSVNSPSIASGNLFVLANNSVNKFRVDFGGNVFTAGTINSGGADVAEEFKTLQYLKPGTVVVMGDSGYKSAKPSEKKNDKTVIGVVSDNAGVIMGQINEASKAKIAMVGVVGVNVTNENGAIKKGDLLVTSDISGRAMRADNPQTGTVIGKALEDFNGQEGNIKALINLQ